MDTIKGVYILCSDWINGKCCQSTLLKNKLPDGGHIVFFSWWLKTKTGFYKLPDLDPQFIRTKIEKQSKERQKKKKMSSLEELTDETTSLKKLFLKNEPLASEHHNYQRWGNGGGWKSHHNSSYQAYCSRERKLIRALWRFLSYFFLPVMATLFFSFPFPKFYTHLYLMYQVSALEI